MLSTKSCKPTNNKPTLNPPSSPIPLPVQFIQALSSPPINLVTYASVRVHLSREAAIHAAQQTTPPRLHPHRTPRRHRHHRNPHRHPPSRPFPRPPRRTCIGLASCLHRR